MGMHQVGYDRPLAPHLNSQFILKAGPEYWGRAFIRRVRYSTSPGSARPGGRILRLGAPGSLWSGGAAQLADVHNCDTGPGRHELGQMRADRVQPNYFPREYSWSSLSVVTV